MAYAGAGPYLRPVAWLALLRKMAPFERAAQAHSAGLRPNLEQAMDVVNTGLQWLADSLGPYAPRLIGAATIAVLAWLAARLVRAAVRRAGAKAGLDARLHNPGFTALLADLAHWGVWLMALPALLGALELKGLLDPVNAMLSRLLGFLPNLLGAAVVLGIGVLMAGIAKRVVSGLLQAAGSEKLAGRLGLASALGERSLAGIAGSLVFALLLLPTLAAALQTLGLDAVTRPVSQLLDSVIALIPKVASAAIILGLAALIGRALAGLVSGLLAGLGINRLPARLGLTPDFRPGGRDTAELAGAVVMAAVMWLALAQACELLGFAMLTNAVAALGVVLAQVLVALLLMIVGLWLAAGAAAWVAASGVAHAPALGRLARAAVLFFAAALALRQAGLPAEIVALAFGAVVGGLALGLALAVGLGGQQAARRLIERLVAAFEKPPTAPASGLTLDPPAVATPSSPDDDGPPPQR